MLTFDTVVKGLILLGAALRAGKSPEPPVRWFGVIAMVWVAASFAFANHRK